MKTVSTNVHAYAVEEYRDLIPEWNDLADRMGTRFAARPTYAARELEDARGTTCVIAARRGGRLVGVLPLSVRRVGPLALGRLAGSGRGVVQDVLCEDDKAAAALWRVVAERKLVFYASSVAKSSRAVGVLEQHAAMNSEIDVVDKAPVVEVPPGTSATDLRSGQTLKRLRKYRKALAVAGTPLTYEIIDTVAHLDRRWSDISRVAESSTQFHERINYLAEPEGTFARDFLRDEAAAGRLTVVGLLLDGQWQAHEIALRSGHRLEAWLTHYEPGQGRWQPGHQLSEWFSNNHDSLGVTQLNLGPGVNDIKAAWSNSDEDLQRVIAVPNGIRAPRLAAEAVKAWENSSSIRRVRQLASTLLS